MCVYVYIYLYLYLYLCILYSSKQTGSIYIYLLYIILYKHSLAWKSTLCVDRRWSGKPKKSPISGDDIHVNTACTSSSKAFLSQSRLWNTSAVVQCACGWQSVKKTPKKLRAEGPAKRILWRSGRSTMPLCHWPNFHQNPQGVPQDLRQAAVKGSVERWHPNLKKSLEKSQHLITIGKTSFSVLPTRSCIFYVFNEKWWCTQNSPKFYESLTRVFIHLWSGKLSRSGFPLDLCP
jgi:hypothetical protein